MRGFVLLSIFFAACVVEPPAPSPPSGDSPDAATSSPDAPALACAQPQASPGSGHHNAGAQCLSCHTGTGAAPHWYAAGTLYSDSGGGTAISGATIEITDANGTTVTIVSADNGNFWTPTPLTAPLHVKASRCPSSKQMSGTAAGACNGCHAAGGSPGRVHL
ncbi:MAG TPA: hypothetical protein VL463_34230 [Kofleriaceae bacterium]|jgi:hypothetical protein|nr:hypothetical protein [Kofleriaceae bacterium]